MPVSTRFSLVILLVAVFLAVDLVNGDFFGHLRKFWTSLTPQQQQQQQQKEDEGVSGKSFSSRGGYYDAGGGGGGYPGGDMMMAPASQRGWGWGGGWGHGDDHQNLDLYSLLGGLSFASLLGATIIYLARRNTSGRRRRSADGLSYLEDDEMDFSEDPQTKGLNIVELLDTFLDNRQIFFAKDEPELNISTSNINSSLENSNATVDGANSRRSFRSLLPLERVHLGPGIVPHTLSDPVY